MPIVRMVAAMVPMSGRTPALSPVTTGPLGTTPLVLLLLGVVVGQVAQIR